MSRWRPLPPGPLPLGPGEVHLVRAWVACTDAALLAHAAALTPDEQARAARLLVADERRRFTVVRALLRRLLGALVAPAPVTLVAGPHGKPRLAGATDLHFNVSHSGDVALLALARALELGVDVEQERADVDVQAVARTVFSPEEQATLAAHATPAARQHAFFRQWARKEAVIKAEGWGFTVPSTTFTVREAPHGLVLQARPGHPPGARPWQLQDVPLAPGYAAALAHAGPASCVPVCWDAGA